MRKIKLKGKIQKIEYFTNEFTFGCKITIDGKEFCCLDRTATATKYLNVGDFILLKTKKNKTYRSYDGTLVYNPDTKFYVTSWHKLR